MYTGQQHRFKEDLGGVVYLLTIDMSPVTGDPTHILRIVNHYGESGSGVRYQNNLYNPHPYAVGEVARSAKDNKVGVKITISDNDDFKISRFIDHVGGNLQEARVTELKVFGVFLDDAPDSNPLAYVKRLDHVVSYTEDSDSKNELIINTIDPLSKDLKVPSISFTAGVPNGTESAINIFPAVDRNISQERG